MIRPPYGLTSLGYKQHPTDPELFTNVKGHPYYPVRITENREYHVGDCAELIAEAAFEVAQITQRRPKSILTTCPHCRTQHEHTL